MPDAERYQHYEVLRREDGSLWELGRGAMGITYKAFDTGLLCPVALKVINNSYLNSEVARQRFLREARATASLRHQNVASVFHLGTDNESYFYAMEFIDGETVDAYVKRKGLLDAAEALGITLQVSRALAAADKEKLVHRDLKPSRWDQLGVKVAAVNFSLSISDPMTWAGAATLTQTVSRGEARASYLRMLSLLVYELLGGQRNSIESTGRYSPVASLSERGNALLRRGLIDDFRSATEFALELGGEIVARNIDPVTTMPVSMSPSGSSAINLRSGMPISPSQPAPPIDDAGQPPSATSSNGEKSKRSVVRLIPVLVFVTGIGLGGYFLYQLFLGAPSAKKGQSANSIAQASAPPMVLASATPNRDALVSPSPEAVATASIESAATPDSRTAGSQSQTMRNSSAADNYPDKLAAAQRLIDNGDWSGALHAYVALIERYPERPAASRSLENFLTDLGTSERKLDSESLAQMKPDLVRAAEDGVLQAMLIVARSSQETDRAAALKWYEAAASKGSVEGMKKAGDLLYSNHKRPDDDLKALNYFVQAAITGDPEAEYLSGECYFFGKGAMPDIDKAMQFLQEAAAQRYTKAMDLLGTCYRKQRKFEQARQSYEQAAAAGYALSFYNLGVLYMNGEGVSRSPKKAEDQFRRSAELSKENAEKGDIISMFYYASWLEQGIGVAKDAKAASEWFRRSARAGYAPAIDWCKRNGAVP